MKKLYFFTILSILVSSVYSQQIEPTVQWNRSKNGQTFSDNQVIKSVRDNAGNTYLLADENSDMVTVKFDNTGSF